MKNKFCLLVACSLLFVGCKENKGEKSSESKINSETNNTEVVKNEDAVKEEIGIHPVEHASAVLTWNDMIIYIDPVGGGDAYSDYNAPNLILLTDIHGDHLNIETLEALETQNAKIIAPKAVMDKLPGALKTNSIVLNNGENQEIMGITIEAIPMYNLREEALKYHTKGRGNGYVLNIGSQRIYLSGDTEDIPEMRALKDIDIALVCMNLPYTMTPESAAAGVLAFKPKKVYPYHYRGKPDVSDVSKFRELVNAGKPNIEVIQLDWYPNNEY